MKTGHPRRGATTIWTLSVTALFAGLPAACGNPGGATTMTAAADAESVIDAFFVQEHLSWPDCREPRIHPMGE